MHVADRSATGTGIANFRSLPDACRFSTLVCFQRVTLSLWSSRHSAAAASATAGRDAQCGGRALRELAVRHVPERDAQLGRDAMRVPTTIDSGFCDYRPTTVAGSDRENGELRRGSGTRHIWSLGRLTFPLWPPLSTASSTSTAAAAAEVTAMMTTT